MKTNTSIFCISVLFSVIVTISCSKSDNENVPDTNNAISKSINFNLNGLDKNQKEIFVWLYKDKSFYDTLTLDSNIIAKGSFQKTLPYGNYQLYAASKNEKFKILAQTTYQAEYGGVPPAYNISIPLTSSGIEIDSSKLQPLINFKVLHNSSRSYTEQAFNDYFITSEINVDVNKEIKNVSLSFKRIGGELTIQINGIERYPNALIYFSLDSYASLYDFNKKSLTAFVGSRFDGNDWAGMFKISNGQSTIVQNISDTQPFRLFFRTKKNINEGTYYLKYINPSTARIQANKRTILEINIEDLLNNDTINPKISSSDQWIYSMDSPDNTNP